MLIAQRGKEGGQMVWHAMSRTMRRLRSKVVSEQEGQGTTEYAILVGVLVVIAIIAIISFKDKVSELWDAISNGINQL